jgi:hypothetical protein
VELLAQIEERALALREISKPVVGTVTTSVEYVDQMRPFIGRKWPVPGSYSPELEVIWKQDE